MVPKPLGEAPAESSSVKPAECQQQPPSRGIIGWLKARLWKWNGSATSVRDSEVYLQDCFDPGLVEQPDPCPWSELPGAHELASAGNGKDWAVTVRFASVLIQAYGDHGLGYYWLAEAYAGLKKDKEAREVLAQGLARASNKYMLCLQMGDLAWARGDLIEAARWWVKSAVVQVRAGKLREHSPFLYISYVADGLGLPEESAALLERVDRMRAGMPRLNAEPAAKLVKASRRCKKNLAVRSAVQRLAREFCAQ